MKKILLTSTGFENKNIEKKFIELLDKDVKDAKVLFVITAAIDIEAVMILSKCADDLLNCGILRENITVYNMHEKIDNIDEYDAMYVCGGSTRYLLNRMNEINFKDTLNKFINNSGIYIGVSAGTVAVSGTYENGIRLILNKIDVHCECGSDNGKIINNDDICLTDNQAIYINDKEAVIFE